MLGPQHPLMSTGPVHRPGRRCRWTTANLDEALPGILTPLTWSFYADTTEDAARAAWYGLGAMTRAERRLPADVDDRFFTAVLGRGAANVDLFSRMADRMPGGSGAALEEQLFGAVASVPGPASSLRERVRRYPMVAARAPRTLRAAMRDLGPRAVATTAWWSDTVEAPDRLVGEHGRAVLVSARARFRGILGTHLVLTMAAQGVLDRVAGVATGAGLPGLERELIRSAAGTTELDLVRDLRRLADGALTPAGFVAVHGYHGAHEGLLDARSWREEPAPVRALAAAYARRVNPEPVADLLARRAAEHAAALARLEAALGPVRAAPARRLVRFAGHVPGWRETGRASILRAVDVGRAAARGYGRWLAGQGALEFEDDVFLLTIDELCALHASKFAPLVEARRAAQGGYAQLELPRLWRGVPPESDVASAPVAATWATRIDGLGVSAGVAVGVVHVVHNQDEADLAEGAILVCRVTDPGWASLFPLAAAVVTDTGSALSHAAIVCRELGLPCVAGTQTGTTTLRDGMRVRVDGNAGTVEVLSYGRGGRSLLCPSSPHED